ncbi:thioesterase domain-containing protein [Tamaricihabitans halophyticus]|uniref:Thioesterase domain-containing protein n=1 Tax=Tamaricihabitans halophyticus TaxID=1262583 RepID=A0A4R2QYE9_9PSEU|nr:alpha/beta hydrolase [Tamaricihabitans halophyticus]TCP55223.1 thioesterase domain-containing protein [Tamaricihabitans halophyticus]
MTLSAGTTRAVLLPGTGSDDEFVRAVFLEPLRAVGIHLHTPAPRPGARLAEHYLDELTRHAGEGPILAGGLSFGAHLAAEWALANPDRCAGLLLALPAWHGAPDEAPAALAAHASADAVAALGVPAALRAATEGIPDWLAAELRRSWPSYGAELATSLRVAARRAAPAAEALETLAIPTGLGGFRDDPVHPIAMAESWATRLPAATLRGTSIQAMATDRAALGRATVLAWLSALGGKPTD